MKAYQGFHFADFAEEIELGSYISSFQHFSLAFREGTRSIYVIWDRAFDNLKFCALTRIGSGIEGGFTRGYSTYVSTLGRGYSRVRGLSVGLEDSLRGR